MGLSAIATTLRRRRGPPKEYTSSKTSPQLSSILQLAIPSYLRNSRLSPPVPQRLRLKELSASDIVDKLAAVDQVVSQEQTDAVAEHVTATEATFAEFVAIASEPSNATGPPRERSKRAWVVSTLIRHGPSVLRDTLVRNSTLVRNLASVFDAPEGELDPALAAHIADIFRVLLHEHPKGTATALYSSNLVSRLVVHIHLQPAFDLLPRFVGTRVFTSLTPAPVIPAHKRAIAMMGNAKVQIMLAKRFIEAAASVLNGNRESLLIVEGCCNAMAEISIRAMSLPRKQEDHDERSDVGYAGNLCIVAAHMYNDAKDHMNLLNEPQPLTDILSYAVKNGRDEIQVLVPTLSVASILLQELRQSRSSLLPTLRKSVLREDTSLFGECLVSLRDEFASLLSEGSGILGRQRLAVIDLLRETCATVEEENIDDLLCGNDFQIVRELLNLVLSYRKNNVLLVRVSQTLSAVFDRCHEVAGKMLRGTNVAHVLHELRGEVAMESALASLVACQSVDRILQDGDSDLRRQLSAIEEFVDEHMKAETDAGLVKGSGFGQPKISEEMANSLNLEEELSTSEDYRQHVFIHGLLDEVGKRETQTPPMDSVMGHVSHDVAKAWNKGLKTRLKAHKGGKGKT